MGELFCPKGIKGFLGATIRPSAIIVTPGQGPARRQERS